MAEMLDRLAASPCCNPGMSLADALAAYSQLGFTKFEVFTSWAGSMFDIDGDPAFYLGKGKEYGLGFTSLHLPEVEDDLSMDRALQGARFAEAIGCDVLLFKAPNRETYIRSTGPFLDAIEGMNVTPVVQNHFGTPISSLADFREVLNGINDPRMKTCLEVGHFHSAGVQWQEGFDLLGESIALVHIKDQVGAQSVPFGTGEVDLPGLFAHMKSVGYEGEYVVEMEVADAENTLQYLADAIAYLQANCEV
ncbi:MAG: sugar phosphate isomerase/epimerase family protein [Planctomycetota bacterium]|jgi:sugar phosphate isomerase/epimerase